jgi:aldehyde:ferredoxin oxidoreductase
MVLCDVHWPMQVTSSDCPSGHVGDPAIESLVLSAITGKATSKDELLLTGERIFNLQRAILLRHGWGGNQGDHILDYFFTHPLQPGEVFFNPEGIMPGPGGKLISRLHLTLDRNGYNKMKRDYYRLRGWDQASGLLKVSKLKSLNLKDTIDMLREQHLAI